MPFMPHAGKAVAGSAVAGAIYGAMSEDVGVVEGASKGAAMAGLTFYKGQGVLQHVAIGANLGATWGQMSDNMSVWEGMARGAAIGAIPRAVQYLSQRLASPSVASTSTAFVRQSGGGQWSAQSIVENIQRAASTTKTTVGI